MLAQDTASMVLAKRKKPHSPGGRSEAKSLCLVRREKLRQQII
jgi:hypothetical protein